MNPVEHAFALRDLIKNLMTDSETEKLLADFVNLCEDKGLVIDEDWLRALIQFTWLTAADAVSAATDYFLGPEAMNDLNDALDDLILMDQEMEIILDDNDETL